MTKQVTTTDTTTFDLDAFHEALAEAHALPKRTSADKDARDAAIRDVWATVPNEDIRGVLVGQMVTDGTESMLNQIAREVALSGLTIFTKEAAKRLQASWAPEHLKKSQTADEWKRTQARARNRLRLLRAMLGERFAIESEKQPSPARQANPATKGDKAKASDPTQPGDFATIAKAMRDNLTHTREIAAIYKLALPGQQFETLMHLIGQLEKAVEADAHCPADERIYHPAAK